MRAGAFLLCSLAAGKHVVLESDVTVFDAPSWTRVARAAPDTKVTPTFMLKHQAAALTEFEQLFYAISTPGNPLYGKHMTKEQIADKLPLVDGAKDAVVDMLSEHGVSDVSVFSDMVKATMTVETAEKLFNAEFFEFEHANGVRVVKVGSGYGVPEEVHDKLYHVADIVQLPALDRVRLVDTPEENNFLDTFPNGCGNKCQGKVTPDVLAALYKFDKSATGLSSTMAVAEFQGVSYDDADLNFWANACGQNATVDRQVGKNKASTCKIPLVGAELCLEALLDIDFIRGVGGDIPLTVVSTQQYSLANWAQALEQLDNAPPVMSVSYGNDEVQQTSESFMDSCNVQFQKLGAQGISVLFASGDQGVVGRTGKKSDGKYHPDFPAASPYITAVGGTDLATKSVIGAEKAWSNGGGGFSDHFTAPDYQTTAVEEFLKKSDAAGVTPAADVFTRTGRAYPDIAAMAGQQNPYCVAATMALTPSLTGVAGTSAACPVAAGLFARLNAARADKGMPNMGFLNPWIYQNPQAWNDVQAGSITGARGVQGFSALEGWDAATGFGTPNFPEMLKAALAAGEQVVV